MDYFSDVKSNVSLEVLASYFAAHGHTVRRVGGGYRSGKNGGLSIYRDSSGARWHDFSENKGGDCFDAVEFCEGVIEKSEQAKIMGEFSHTAPTVVESTATRESASSDTTKEEDVAKIFESTAERWKRNLCTPAPQKILDLRGIDRSALEVAKDYLGYCYSDWVKYQGKNILIKDSFVFWSPDHKSFCAIPFSFETGKRLRENSCIRFFGANAIFSPLGCPTGKVCVVVESQMDALAFASVGVFSVASLHYFESRLALLLYDQDKGGQMHTNHFLDHDPDAIDIRGKLNGSNDLGDYLLTFNDPEIRRNMMKNLINTKEIEQMLNAAQLDNETKETMLKLEKYKNEKTGLYRSEITALKTAISCYAISKTKMYFDTFKQLCMIQREEDEKPAPIVDKFVRSMITKMDAIGFRNPTFADVKQAILTVGEENAKDTMIEHLNTLPKWDGKSRIEDFAFKCLKSGSKKEHIIPILQYFLTALYARAACTSPEGVKADTVIVLQGTQGIYKSTVLKHLVFDESQYGELKLKVNDPNDRVRKMKGKLICEIAELGGMLKMDDYNDVKAFFSIQVDEYTEKWSTFSERFVRRGMLVLTTNETNFIPDFDENSCARRFAVIKVGDEDSSNKVDLNWIDDNRDQLWAEAKALYETNGVMWQGLDEVQKETNKSYRVSLPGQDEIEDFVIGNDYYVIKNAESIIKAMSGKNVFEVNRTDITNVCKVLRSIGFVKKNRRIKESDVNENTGIASDMIGKVCQVFVNSKIESKLDSYMSSFCNNEYF